MCVLPDLPSFVSSQILMMILCCPPSVLSDVQNIIVRHGKKVFDLVCLVVSRMKSSDVIFIMQQIQITWSVFVHI